MHLIALVDHPDHVCCRYRLAAFRPHLEAAGHTLELRSWPRPWWGWWSLPAELAPADLVIVQRKLLSPWQLFWVRRASRRLAFDFDDAVFLRDSWSPKGLHSRRRTCRFAALLRACTFVVAGNSFLRDEAVRWSGTERIHVIPTCVDPARYPLARHERAEDPQLVWVGSSSTLRGLEAIRPVLESLGQRLPGVRLKLICDRFLELWSLPVEACPWSEATEGVEIARADIGIGWVPDDRWSHGKCGLKVLQYMAAGLPVVANPVGVQAEMVRHGETGFLAETPAQWLEAVGRLARDPDLRRRMGAAGRRRLEQEYGVEVGARRWLALLNRLRHRQAA